MTTLSFPSVLSFVALAALAAPAGCSSSSATADAFMSPFINNEGGVGDDAAGFSYDGQVDAGGLISLCGASVGCSPDETALKLASEPACSGGPVADAGVGGDGGSPTPVAHACRVEPGVSSPTSSCELAGPGKDGDACTSGSDCSAGFECVSTPGRCRHYCCNSSLCAAIAKQSTNFISLFCDVQSESAHPGVKVPVCLPVQDCQLLGDACGLTRTCAIVDSSAGIKSCVETGPAQVGQSCEASHCAANLSCLGSPGKRTCEQLCDPTKVGACPTGQACKQPWTVLKQDNAGICQ